MTSGKLGSRETGSWRRGTAKEHWSKTEKQIILNIISLQWLLSPWPSCDRPCMSAFFYLLDSLHTDPSILLFHSDNFPFQNWTLWGGRGHPCRVWCPFPCMWPPLTLGWTPRDNAISPVSLASPFPRQAHTHVLFRGFDGSPLGRDWRKK